MSELNLKFDSASHTAQKLSSKPDNDTLLKMYSLYKQATVGDVFGKRPGFTDLRGRAKYDAWARLRGTKPEFAKERYVELIHRLAA